MRKELSFPPSLLCQISQTSFMYSDCWFEDGRDDIRLEIVRMFDEATRGKYSGRGRARKFFFTDEQLKVLQHGVEYVDPCPEEVSLVKAQKSVLRQIRTHLLGKPIIKVKRETAHNEFLRKEAEIVIHAAVKEMSRVALRVSSDLPLPPRWRPKVKIAWLKSRSTSRGGYSHNSGIYGGGGISLVPSNYIPLDGKGNGKFTWKEYARIAADPTIGTFSCNNWQLVIKALVAHEVAHAIQRYICHNAKYKGRHAKIDYDSPHGRGWRQIYALLRRECVNPYI